MKTARLVTLLVLSASCASLGPSRPSGDRPAEMATLARAKVRAALTGLSDAERRYVEEHEPRYRVYVISGTYADYSVSWDVDDAHRILVSGRGDLTTLEGATVRRIRRAAEAGPPGEEGGR